MTWEWVYDGAGNILSKTEYNHTTGTLDTVTYTYSNPDIPNNPNNPNWRDLLIEYDGVEIEYDAIGNPLSYGAWTYTWEYGRQLASMSKGSTTWTFTYDVNGMRTGRSNGSITYTYLYNGSQLTQMTRGSVVMRFSYGTDGRPLVISYNDTPYYYITNLQGDVVAIMDSYGTTVVNYAYDAWGRVTITNDVSYINLGEINPLRYRGYIYDHETGLYYLQSRYYNPTWGRFINADAYTSTGQGALNNNMFAYCCNNPINMTDSTGNWPEWIESAAKIASAVIAVAAVVATVSAVTAFTAGTGTVGAVYVSSIVLGAALSGINGGIANESQGNSYLNGYVGGATGGAIQSSLSKSPIGTILGGGLGVTVGTTITEALNNVDPDSSHSSAGEIAEKAFTSGGKALVTSSLTAYMGYASDLAATNGANGLMPTYTFGFGEAVKAFFGWLDDAIVYIWE